MKASILRPGGSVGIATATGQQPAAGMTTVVLESNWLPAPPDSFKVFMRLYWPGEAILDGTWKMPSVERVPSCG